MQEGIKEQQRLVSQTEIVQTATAEATRLIDSAHAEADRLRGECDIYVDSKLAGVRGLPERNPSLGGPRPPSAAHRRGHPRLRRTVALRPSRVGSTFMATHAKWRRAAPRDRRS